MLWLANVIPGQLQVAFEEINYKTKASEGEVEVTRQARDD